MISISKDNIPTFLADSYFASGLNSNDDSVFDLPILFCKFDLNLSRQDDLKALLSTMCFWGVREIPNELIDHCLNDTTAEFEAAVGEFSEKFPFLKILQLMKTEASNHWLDLAIEQNSLEIVAYLRDRGHELNVDHSILAAGRGALDILRFLHEHNCPWDATTSSQAAWTGQLACLQYAHEHGCPWNSEVCANAAGNGHLECLHYSHQHGCAWNDRTCYVAAMRGKLDCLQYAMDNGCHWDGAVCTWAVHGDQRSVLEFLFTRGAVLSADLSLEACRSGSLLCLQYLHRQHSLMPVQSDQLCVQAAAHGHLNCLQYVHENGVPWAESTCRVAAASGSLACLQYAHTQGCPWDIETAYTAACLGKHFCLQYALQNGCPRQTMPVIQRHSLAPRTFRQPLQPIVSSPQSSSISNDVCNDANIICNIAAQYGQLACLQTAYENGCSWGVDTTAVAAKYGQLECLKFLHAHDCPWDGSTCHGAAEGGHVACLNYALDHGCPTNTSSSSTDTSVDTTVATIIGATSPRTTFGNRGVRGTIYGGGGSTSMYAVLRERSLQLQSSAGANREAERVIDWNTI